LHCHFGFHRGIGLYRFHLGAYRVVYALQEEEPAILVLRTGHRREVYHRLPG
jgi:mRNA-degrading endonuclease RelE of RelBE toxin-antitoxin system